MKDVYVKILADHAADVIKLTSGLTPGRVSINGRPQEPPLCELAVRIDFGGSLSDDRNVRGYLTCGAVSQKEFLPLLAAIAGHLGLEASVLESPDGPKDILSEFLNIIIGLTGADWSSHGFVMDFGPPADLSGRPPEPLNPSDQAYHLTLDVPSENGLVTKVDLLAVFSA